MDVLEPPAARERRESLFFRMTVLEPSTELSQKPAGSRETVISCLVRIGAQLGIDIKIEAVRHGTAGEGDRVSVSGLIKLADELGFHAEWGELDWHELKTTDLSRPLLIFRKNSDAVIVTGDGRPGADEVSIWDPGHDGVIFYVPREEIKHTWNGHALIITAKEQATNSAQPLQVSDTAVVSNIPEKTSPAPATRQPRSLRPLVITASGAIVTIVSIAIFFLVRVGPDHATPLHTVAREGANNPTQSQIEPGRTVADGAIDSASESTTNKAVAFTAPVPAAEQNNSALNAARPSIASKSDTDANVAPPQPPTPPPAQTLPQAMKEAASSAPAEPSSAADPNGVASAPTVLPAASGSSATASSGETRLGGDNNTAATVTAPAHGASAAELAALLERGDVLFSKGDLLAARLFYERAADGGDGQAALKLGETFDPVFLDRAHLRGARGDWSMALSWYRRARDLGVGEAENMLKILESK
jgi:hypothetical protein